ncbi:hypothetical protein ACOZ35_03355 [Halorubrum xinjiangense]|uniref:hypothetical protein n=1 Tax=Halorubrum xinjiangense TaxID=261291 RepID=UPI003C6FCB23
MKVPVALLGGVSVGSLFLFIKDGATVDVQFAALVGLVVVLSSLALLMVMADD